MIYLILFILFTSIANILLNFFGDKIPSMLLIFLSTTYAVVFFNLINLGNIIVVYKKLLHRKQDYFLLLTTLLGIWLGAFLIPIYFLPSIYLFTFMAICSAFGATELYYKKKETNSLLRAICLFVIVVLFYIVCMQYYSWYKYLILITATIFTATSGYGYLLISARFNKHHFTSSQVLAVRFWLLWFISLGGSVYYNQFQFLSLESILQTLVISSLYLIIPIYCSQKAIETIGPERTSLGMAFTPIATFALEKVFLNNAFNFIGCFALFLAIILIVFHLNKMFLSKYQNQILHAKTKSSLNNL